MAVVIGQWGEFGAGSGEGTFVPIFSAQVNYSVDVAPATFTVTLDGSAVESNPFLIDPQTPKSLLGGDEAGRAIFNDLYIETADFSESVQGNSVVTITGQDSRVWWYRRPPYGPRVYNIPFHGEKVLPGGTGGATFSDNRRYPAHLYRTAGQIITEILDWLGVSPTLQATGISIAGGGGLASTAGFLDLELHQIKPTSQVARGSVTIPLADDTPEFVIPAGMSAVEALQKFQALYGIVVAIDPLDGRVGFLRASDFANKLDNLQDVLENFRVQDNGVDRNPVRAWGEAKERDNFPDTIQITGSPILIEERYALEPVIKDPDRPHRYLPLFRKDTLIALGIDMTTPDRAHLENGEDIMRLVCHMTVSNWPEVPERLKQFAKDALRLWRVAQPLEPVDDDLYAGGGAGSIRFERKAIPGGFTQVERAISPAYRLKQDNRLANWQPLTVQGVGRQVFEPTINSDEAQSHRWLPLLGMRARKTADSDPGTSSFPALGDGDHGATPPVIMGVNVVMPLVNNRSMGASSPDWTDLNFHGPIAGHPDPRLAEELAITPKIIDAQQGVIDTGVAIFGNNGAIDQGANEEVSITAPTLASAGFKRSLLVAILDGGIPGGSKGRTAEMIWPAFERAPILGTPSDPQGEPASESPWGSPFLWLVDSHLKACHTDLRDITVGISETQIGDPYITAETNLEAFQRHVETNDGIGALRNSPAPTAFARPSQVADLKLPALQLRCESSLWLQGKNNFERQGFWRSGFLGGRCEFGDITLQKFSDVAAALQNPKDVVAGSLGPGTFYPISGKHYDNVFSTMQAIVAAEDAHIGEYRKTNDALRAINADILGWHRRFLPGTREFQGAPVESCALSLSASVPEASMRFTANGVAYRPFVGGLLARKQSSLTSARAGYAAAAHMFGGSGGGSGYNLMGQATIGQSSGYGGAGAREYPASEYRRLGIGHPPKTHADRRHLAAVLKTGGRIDETQDEAFFVQPIAGSALVKREGPRLRTFVPGDWNDIIQEPFDRSDDGQTYHTNLDGSSTLFGPLAADVYNREVGTTQGTCHLPQEPNPVLRIRQLGPAGRERHGDFSWVIPDIYFKRRLQAGHGPGQGGVNITQKPDEFVDPETGEIVQRVRTAEEAATQNRRLIRKTDTEDLVVQIPGISEELTPMIEGPGWAGLFTMFQEDLPLHAESNILLRGAEVESPFEGDQLDTETVHDYLILDVQQAVVTTSPTNCRDYCDLDLDLSDIDVPERVDLNPYSHQVGIALLAEWTERAVRAIGSPFKLIEGIRKAWAYADAVAEALVLLVCCVIDNDTYDDFRNCVVELQELFCMLPCPTDCNGNPKPVATGDCCEDLRRAPPGP